MKREESTSFYYDGYFYFSIKKVISGMFLIDKILICGK